MANRGGREAGRLRPGPGNVESWSPWPIACPDRVRSAKWTGVPRDDGMHAPPDPLLWPHMIEIDDALLLKRAAARARRDGSAKRQRRPMP